MAGQQVDKEKYYQARINILEQLNAQLQDSLAAVSVQLQEVTQEQNIKNEEDLTT